MKTLLRISFFLIINYSLLILNCNAQPGSLDMSFNPGTGADDTVYTPAIYTIAIQNDGKIIIGGLFATYNSMSRNWIARLNTDGMVDTTFNPGTGANCSVNTIVIQSDGKIIIGGCFTNYNGTNRNYIVRLNYNGTLDSTFNSGTGTDGAVYTTAIQSDGKIIIGGGFTTYNGTSRRCIARLNTDGNLDTTFNPGTGANGILTTAIQNDGKIIIGGDFFIYNGIERNYIARLNTDGTLDTTFNPGIGANDAIGTISIQNDGKIIIGGEFTTYSNTGRNYIARLNINGTLDTTFNPGLGAGYWVQTSAIQSDGKIMIGGNFSTYNGTSRNKIARLNGDVTTGIPNLPFQNSITITPNPFSQSAEFRFTSELSGADVILKVYDITGREVAQQAVNFPGFRNPESLKTIRFDGSKLPAGVYLYRLSTNQTSATGKMVIVR